MEDEEKKRAIKRVAVRIMASEDTHAGIMEFFRRSLGEPSRMLGLKNAVYVEVFGDTMGQRLMHFSNVEWRRGEPLRMQVMFARMSLDRIVKYIEAGSDPRGHLGVTWGVYLCAGKPPLADIILSHPPDLTRCDSAIGLVIAAMSGNIRYRGTASGDLYIGISGSNRVLLS